MTEKKKNIEVITGETNPNILLIAPHGVKGDDDNAGKLARAIQKRLGCNAIINEAYRRPKKDEKTGEYEETDIDKRVANLNFKTDAEKHPTFINILKEKIKDPGNTHIFWIHGIDDKNIPDEAKKLKTPNLKCLVGYGQGKGNGNSMDEKKVKDFIKFLNDNNLPTMATHAQSEDYRGASATNMNQYFKIPGSDLVGVQSVQLEFADKEVREGKHIAETAEKVARAISNLLKCETVNIPEKKEDEALVKEATEKVMGYIKENHQNSITVGRYLIEMFYDDKIENARKGKKAKGKSLNKMLNDLEKKPDTPSKSWFYNTINLAVDTDEFKKDTDYEKLNLSHKIYLTYLNKNDKQRKKRLGLIKEIARDGMLIKDLIARIAEIKAEINPKQETPSLEDLTKMDDIELDKQRNKYENRKKVIQNALDKLNAKMAKQQAELQKYEQVLSAINDTNLQAAA